MIKKLVFLLPFVFLCAFDDNPYPPPIAVGYPPPQITFVGPERESENPTSTSISVYSGTLGVNDGSRLHRWPEFNNIMDTAPNTLKPQSEPVTVFIVDTGVPMLTGCGLSVIEQIGEVTNPHGTWVAGAMIKYLPEGSKIISYTALNQFKQGTWKSVTESLEWAVENSHKIDIVNMSLSATQPPVNEYFVRIERSVRNLRSLGIPVLSSAFTNGIVEQESWPANFPLIWGVSGVNFSPQGNPTRASYSNYDENLDFSAIGYEDTFGYNCQSLVVSGPSIATAVATGIVSHYIDGTEETIIELERLFINGVKVEGLPINMINNNRVLSPVEINRNLIYNNGGEITSFPLLR